MPVDFNNVFADGTFIGLARLILAMHVSSSRQMVVRKFDDEDLRALFFRVSSAFSGMSQLMNRKALRDQAFLVMSLLHVLGLVLAACWRERFCMSSSNGFTVDCETG
jgi:hypothetical protein